MTSNEVVMMELWTCLRTLRLQRQKDQKLQTSFCHHVMMELLSRHDNDTQLCKRRSVHIWEHKEQIFQREFVKQDDYISWWILWVCYIVLFRFQNRPIQNDVVDHK